MASVSATRATSIFTWPMMCSLAVIASLICLAVIIGYLVWAVLTMTQIL